MKYSLRSLMIVVTLVCVVLGGRIEYLRRMAAYHEREAAILDEGATDFEGYWSHTQIANEYRWAMLRPWSTVNESPRELFPKP
ncbi:MAG: hypothetical protein ACR2FY_24560 [Pirellulaceae bacterium]